MATPRPKPQVMRLSEAAARRIQDVIGKAERPIAGVRVGVKNGGCAGMSYTMEYAETVNPLDYGVLTGHLARAFRSIGVERRPPTLSLQAYLSATQQPVESDEGESDLVVVANADEQG